MTRGTFFLVTDSEVFRSTEFNGDMYPEKPGYGVEALEMLKPITTKEEFTVMVEKFNREHHNYDDEQLVWDMPYNHPGEEEPGFFDAPNFCDMSNGYFDGFRFFSDYLFIKNASQVPFNIRTKDQQQTIKLSPGKAIRLNYGNLENDAGRVWDYAIQQVGTLAANLS